MHLSSCEEYKNSEVCLPWPALFKFFASLMYDPIAVRADQVCHLIQACYSWCEGF